MKIKRYLTKIILATSSIVLNNSTITAKGFNKNDKFRSLWKLWNHNCFKYE